MASKAALVSHPDRIPTDHAENWREEDGRIPVDHNDRILEHHVLNCLWGGQLRHRV